eukprot:3724628-Pyramimonas_sp.AAC.1
MLRHLCCAIYAVQLNSVRNELLTPLVAQSFHPPTRKVVCMGPCGDDCDDCLLAGASLRPR